jgi:hypothetical protein
MWQWTARFNNVYLRIFLHDLLNSVKFIGNPPQHTTGEVVTDEGDGRLERLNEMLKR